MALGIVEKWAYWSGAAAGFAVLATAMWWGVWRGLQRSAGRTTGIADKVLRAPLQILFGLLWFGLCLILWRPVPVTLSVPVRVVASTLGVAFYFPGLALYLWGTRTLGELYRASSGLGVRLNAEHRLITHGPFALVRHPLYLGLQIAALGGFLVYRTWTFVFVAASFLSLVVRARREEQALAAEFGQEWDAYCQRVPGWIPHLRRYMGWR